jgi:prepilin-type N-terminal cleavage/methylation domain-containing protein
MNAIRIERGFTFIELIIVVTLMGILGTMATSYYARFYVQNSVDDIQVQLLSSLRKAQLFSMLSKRGTGWGVNYASNTITLFAGSTYSGRTTAYDENYTVPNSITVSGLNEIDFSRISGLPSATATITISGNNTTRQITVNSQGVASR